MSSADQPERRALAQSAVRDLTQSSPDGGGGVKAVRRWIGSRPWIVGPGALVGFAGMAWAGLPPARLVAVGAIFAVMVGVMIVQAAGARREATDRRSVFVSLLVCIVAAAGVAGVSGGIASPYLVSVLGPTIVTVVAFGPGREATVALAIFAASLLGLALLPADWTAVAFTRSTHELLTLLALAIVIILVVREVRLLSKGLLAASRSLRTMSDELLHEAAQRRREIESMSAKVAHEIKNPLTALKSLLQLEKAGARDERSQKRFEVMTSEVARIEAIVRDYLSQAKPLGVMAIADVDLARLADDVIAVLEGRAGDAGVELRRDGKGAVVPGDERRLKEAVLNLGQNAVEATPAGGTVTISVDTTADAARILVRDTGSGIAASVRGRLGTSFVTTREQGTGLGLAIARGIIKQHQGTLEIENRPEGGAVATVILPLRPAPKETHGADPAR